MKTWVKGMIVGLVVTFVFWMIMSYMSPYYNYSQQKEDYEEYNFIVQSCGQNPGDDCVEGLCPISCVEGLCTSGSQKGFCEAFMDKRLDQLNNYTSPAEFYDWRHRVRTDKPNIAVLLIPNISDGLAAFFMFGYLGIGIFLLPIILGALIGWLVRKINPKNEETIT